MEILWDGHEDEPLDLDTNGVPGDHESPTRLASRLKDKQRVRPNHLHKGKAVKDKRKLREKRRSTGVVHLQQPASTESTGDSLDEDHETRKNTAYNEFIDEDNPQTPEEERKAFAARVARRNKSPSDLEADFEDNQDYDSTVSQSESNLATLGNSSSNGNQQSESPVRKAQACAASRIMNSQNNGFAEVSRAMAAPASRETTPTASRTAAFGKTNHRTLDKPKSEATPSHSTNSTAFQSSQRVHAATKSNTSRTFHHHSQPSARDAVTESEARRGIDPNAAASQPVHWPTPPVPRKSPPKSKAPATHVTNTARASHTIFPTHRTPTRASPEHTSPTNTTPTHTPTHTSPTTVQQNYSLADLALRMRELEMALSHERLERQREREERLKLQQLLLQRDDSIDTLQREVHFLQQELENIDDVNQDLRNRSDTLLKTVTRQSHE